MPDIKIYIACHKQSRIPKHPFLIPVQVGAAMTKQRFSGFYSDAEGEHISDKNPSYCELTAQYWAWKNQQADYYGFFHYRRFLSFQDTGAVSIVCPELTEQRLQQYGYDISRMASIVNAYDLILPRREQTAETVYEKYIAGKGHNQEDLDCMMELLYTYAPAYRQAMEQYLYGHQQYYYNLYIMQKKYFFQYCQWLFPLLQQFDQCNHWEKYNGDRNALRVDGYLAERMFGVWYTFQTMHSDMRVLELPYLYIVSESPIAFGKAWLKQELIPAGSRRKCYLKRLSKKWRTNKKI